MLLLHVSPTLQCEPAALHVLKSINVFTECGSEKSAQNLNVTRGTFQMGFKGFGIRLLPRI